MARALDPYRTLDLHRDATLDEVKGAYRRLAKLYHPDSAGEKALPRFLAIQAAYEALTEGPARLRLGTTPRSRTGTGAVRRPYEAERDRARATRDAAAGGARGARSGSADGGGSQTPPGATGRPSRATGGSASGPRRPGSGGVDGDRAGRRGPGGGEAAGGTAGGAAGGTAGTTGRSRRQRRRPSSTSYDGAEFEPFEPAWDGGTWYGESSGTYWTINPKEYADPRKHGPDYLSRKPAAGSAASSGFGRAASTTPDTADSRYGGPTPPSDATGGYATGTAGPPSAQTPPAADLATPRRTVLLGLTFLCLAGAIGSTIVAVLFGPDLGGPQAAVLAVALLGVSAVLLLPGFLGARVRHRRPGDGPGGGSMGGSIGGSGEPLDGRAA